MVLRSIEALERVFESYRKMTPLQTTGLTFVTMLVCLVMGFYVYTLWFPKSMRDIVKENIELVAEKNSLRSELIRSVENERKAFQDVVDVRKAHGVVLAELKTLKESLPTAATENIELRKQIESMLAENKSLKETTERQKETAQADVKVLNDTLLRERESTRVESKKLTDALDRQKKSSQAELKILMDTLERERKAALSAQQSLEDQMSRQGLEHAAANQRFSETATEAKSAIETLSAKVSALEKKNAELAKSVEARTPKDLEWFRFTDKKTDATPKKRTPERALPKRWNEAQNDDQLTPVLGLDTAQFTMYRNRNEGEYGSVWCLPAQNTTCKIRALAMNCPVGKVRVPKNTPYGNMTIYSCE